MEAQKLGRYEILSEIGRGAMGVVYKASDPMLNRTVAVKTISMSLDPGERQEYEARFFQEAKAAGGLNHPNIVTVYDIGNSGNVAYMAMEYLEGMELRALLTGKQRLKVAQAINVAAQIAEGLAYAHERGVVHRDVKPPNIMILRDGSVKITDFGIARMRTAEVQTQAGTLLGSPKYMSPEQVVGKRADQRSDVFSLGIILYEMLTGSPPFSGESVNALMYQIVNFIPPAPSAVNPAVPEMLDYIVAKMLAKKLDERYQNAGEVAGDLRECAKLSVPEAAHAPAEDAPPDSTAAGPAPNLVDSDLKAQLMAQTLQRSRQDDDVQETIDTAPTLGISRAFDSLEATQKLAAQTGMAEEFDAYSTTPKLKQPGATAPRTTADTTLPGGRTAIINMAIIKRIGLSWTTGWSNRDVVILGASAFAGLIVASVIVLY